MSKRTRQRQAWNTRSATNGNGSSFSTVTTVYKGTTHYSPFTSLAAVLDFEAPRPGINFGLGDTDTITDTVSSKSMLKQRRKPWNACVHTQVRCHNGPYQYAQKNGVQWSVRGGCYRAPIVATSSSLPSFSSSDIATLRAAAYQAMVPRFEASPKFSGLNFIWELKDLKGAVGLCSGGITAIANHWKETFSGVGLDLYKTRKTASQLVLQHDFAIAPLVSDAAQMTVQLSRLRKRLLDFNTKGSVPVTHHYSSDVATRTTYTTSADGFWITYLVTRKIFRAQADLTYHMNVGPMSRLDELVESWGLDVTPGRLWNMIPLSFIVDWFFKVGDFLETLDRTAYAFPRVSRYSETLVTEAYQVTMPRKSSYGGWTHQWCQTTCVQPPSVVMDAVKASGSFNSDTVAWSLVKSYQRQPTDWMANNFGPFSHLVLPSFQMPFSGGGAMRRIRDGLAMIGSR